MQNIVFGTTNTVQREEMSLVSMLLCKVLCNVQLVMYTNSSS